MKLSTKGRYGLRIMVDLAIHEKGYLSVNEISKRQDISFPYVEQLLVQLRKASLVESVRGPDGGYRLSKPASKISVSQILQIVEGPLKIVFCTGIKNETKECARIGECATQLLWTKLSQQMTQLLDGVSLEELANWEKELKKKNTCKEKPSPLSSIG